MMRRVESSISNIVVNRETLSPVSIASIAFYRQAAWM